MNLIKKGLSTWVGIAGFLAAFLIPLLNQLANDDPTPFGLSGQTWLWIGVTLTALSQTGRYAKAVLDYFNQPIVPGQGITWGVATYLGLAGGVAAILGPLLTDWSSTVSDLGVDPKVWVIGGSVLMAVTVLGRMSQQFASTMGWYRGKEPIDTLPLDDAGYIGDTPEADMPELPPHADPEAPTP